MLERGLTKQEVKDLPKGFNPVNQISYTDPITRETTFKTVNRRTERISLQKNRKHNNRKLTKSRLKRNHRDSFIVPTKILS